ncbi:hypothetical protein AB0B15_26635 [Streptomyces sp. NPDC045456]|uniref:hypothetical protein n=1 Tax=Streptomyces sp. NPDC045456 TaxID=3155254 RepID=UPI0033C73E1A
MRPDLEQKIVAALPQDERFVGGFSVMRATTGQDSVSSDAPAERRPRALAGEGALWGAGISASFKGVINDVGSPSAREGTEDPAKRPKRQRKNASFFGGRDSLAGQWLAAAQPRSRAGLVTTVVLTDKRLRFEYILRRRLTGRLGDTVELGASFSPDSLTWTRRRNTHLDMQFGFTDGSWGTVMAAPEEDFLQVFPGTLSHLVPIP